MNEKCVFLLTRVAEFNLQLRGRKEEGGKRREGRGCVEQGGEWEETMEVSKVGD